MEASTRQPSAETPKYREDEGGHPQDCGLQRLEFGRVVSRPEMLDLPGTP